MPLNQFFSIISKVDFNELGENDKIIEIILLKIQLKHIMKKKNF